MRFRTNELSSAWFGVRAPRSPRSQCLGLEVERFDKLRTSHHVTAVQNQAELVFALGATDGILTVRSVIPFNGMWTNMPGTTSPASSVATTSSAKPSEVGRTSCVVMIPFPHPLDLLHRAVKRPVARA